MYASYHGHYDVVQALLRAGADATFRNKAGQTAAQLSRQGGHEEVHKALEIGPNIIELPIGDLLKVTTCGWLLSVLRSHSKHQFQYRSSGDPHFSVDRTCSALSGHGLDGNLGELLEVVGGILSYIQYMTEKHTAYLLISTTYTTSFCHIVPIQQVHFEFSVPFYQSIFLSFSPRPFFGLTFPPPCSLHYTIHSPPLIPSLFILYDFY
jgi:hypothetical protein